MIAAYEGAGGGADGERAANAVYEAAANDVTSATIVLSSQASDRTRLHELGHIHQALSDPVAYVEQANEAAEAPTSEACNATASEIYAENFADMAGKKEPEPEHEQ